jgi:hypothetical protein
MGDNAELIAALREHGKKLDLNSVTYYKMLQSQQALLARSTPTTALFGSYGFNPGNNATVLAAWRQIVPRNVRRRRITISAQNQSLYLSHSETEIGMSDLIKWQQLGLTGRIPATLITFATGQGLQIESTEAIYVASLTGAGSVVEQAAVVNWIEEIYSSIDADPNNLRDSEKANMPGELQRLTAGAMRLDGDEEAEYNRAGVR